MPRKVSTQEEHFHTFRADTERLGYENIKNRIERMLKENDLIFPRYIISFEYGKQTGKPHFQGFIATYLKAKSAYATKVGSYFKDLEASEKSFKPMKEDFWKTYICKDDKIIFSKGYTEKEIQDFHDQYDHNYARKVSNDAKHKKARANHKKESFNQLVDKFKLKGITMHSSGWDIAEAYIDLIEEGENPYESNEFQQRCICKSVQRRLLYSEATPEQLAKFKRIKAKDIIGGVWVDPIDFI